MLHNEYFRLMNMMLHDEYFRLMNYYMNICIDEI